MREQFELEVARAKGQLKAELEHQAQMEAEQKAQPGEVFGGIGFNNPAPMMKREEYLGQAKGWVFSCVSAIADAIAGIEFRLNKVSKNGEVTPVENHAILDLLYRVNPVQTKHDFWYLATMYLELLGESPIFCVRNNEKSPPTALMLLLPDRFRPDMAGSVNAQSFIPYDHFKYRVESGRDVRFELWETLFLKYPDPVRPYRGVGTLSAAARTVDIDNYSEEFNKSFYFNSARPDSVLKTEKSLTKKQREDLRKLVRQVYGGTRNAHKTMILEHGFDFKPMSFTQKDMDFLEQQRFSRDKILSIFRVPKSVAAVTEDVNLASARTGQQIFLEFTVLPKMKRIVEQLNEFLIPMFPDAERQGMFLSFDPPAPDDLDAKLKRYQSGLSLGWLTPNEVRFEENLDDLGPEGDLPLPLRPIDASGQPVRSLEGIKINGKGMNKEAMQKRIIPQARKATIYRVKEVARAQEAKKAIEDHRIETLTKKLTEMIKTRLLAKRAKKKAEQDRATKLKEYWGIWDKEARGKEDDLKSVMVKVFNEQESRILSRVKSVKRNKGVEDWLLDIDSETLLVVNLSTPVIREVFVAQGKEAMKLVGKDPAAFNVNLKRVIDFIKKNTKKFASDINSTTNEKLRSALLAGVRAGEGVDDLRGRVQRVFKEASESRAEAIARTQVLLASNRAAEEAYKQSEVVVAKEWLVAQDGALCPICEQIARKYAEANLGENFFDKGDRMTYTDEDGKRRTITFDYRAIDGPPAHPNCRCTLVPILTKE